MTNQERLQEYLVGNNGYLKNDISNGKVIMLSGKWGSGKTHFWQNIIAKDLTENQTKKQKAYVYSSLYGNRTIDKIEDNIYAQAYLCSVGGKNAVLSGYEKVKDFGKRFGSFCSLLDVSKLVDGIDDIQQKNIKKSALSYLENGGIVCFDDFERKSKDIDLNDLFGFISHLAIDLNCKVVIILNDDVFEDVEKDVFSRVKEKSVSKFLKYEPSIRDLFKSIIFQKNSEKKFKYSKLRKHLKVILNTVEETKELNARIYIQILDNLVEWIGKNQETDENILRCLILVNINFILFHTILCREKPKNKKMNFYIHGIDKLKDWEFDYFLINFFGMAMVDLDYVVDNMENAHVKHPENFEKYVIRLKDKKTNKKDISEEKVKEIKKFIEDNLILFKSDYFANKLDISKNISDETFQKINNFIETGILINE
jgi:DNA polymerase III delta prime subunit